MKHKIATARGGGGKSLVRELVMQSVDMTGLFQLGDVFPEVERLGRVFFLIYVNTVAASYHISLIFLIL